jgi:hypothetical protein
LAVTASPTNRALGHKVNLTLSGQAEGIEINWSRACLNGPPLEQTAGECGCAEAPSPGTGFPHNPAIYDSPVKPGTYVYKATVGSDVASASVTIHPPNQATTTIGSIHTTHWPLPSGGTSYFDQTMTTKLKWNGQPLGPCAKLCYKEKVTIQSTDENLLRFMYFKHSDWIPGQCTVDYYGNPLKPSLATLSWQSPNLIDENWKPWSFSEFKYIQSLEVNTIIATRQHQYQFYGDQCDGWQWGPFVYTVWLDMKIEGAKNSAGSPVPIPGSNPVRYFKWPIWVVRTSGV